MSKLSSLIRIIKKEIIKKTIYINVDLFMNLYVNYLRKLGITIYGKPKFISQDVYFDSNDYSKIILGENITISREVMFLTHDYSITTGVASLGKIINRHEGELYFSKGISVGENCFIGARVSILPGTTIGNNVIVGACTVVKGNIPDNSIILGNPCRVIGNTKEWAEKKMNKNEFFIEK